MAEPVVIGAMLTSFGLKSWFWACRPSRIVAVPGGFWVAIQAASITAGIGGVAASLTTAPGQKKGARIVEQLLAATDEELLAMPGAVAYRIDDLEAIECKRPLVATNPDFVIVRNDGSRQKYGLANAIAFDAVVTALRDYYGDLVQQL
jgi:hypothetical protein